MNLNCDNSINERVDSVRDAQKLSDFLMCQKRNQFSNRPTEIQKSESVENSQFITKNTNSFTTIVPLSYTPTTITPSSKPLNVNAPVFQPVN